MHLPSDTLNKHPNKKLRSVDFPEFYGPSIEITNTFECLSNVSNKSVNIASFKAKWSPSTISKG